MYPDNMFVYVVKSMNWFTFIDKIVKTFCLVTPGRAQDPIIDPYVR